MTQKIAVIICNLGGPDRLSAVRPFLFNLFNDHAIIALPQPFRAILAWIISKKRDKKAQGIYRQMGGKSPILEETMAQKQALEIALNAQQSATWKVFVSMRYWHPFAEETRKEIEEWAPDETIVLPLYPQFSTTTTGSSWHQWKSLEDKAVSVKKPAHLVCCYPTHPRFIDAHVALLTPYLETMEEPRHVIFSAHGLPKKIIDKGDPYQWQVEQTVAAIVTRVTLAASDYSITYQSKVGPLEWIGPATEEVIAEKSREGVSLIIVPIAFVSEHSETLVELDIDYKTMAEEEGAPHYARVPALSTHPDYIAACVELCHQALNSPISCGKATECPAEWTACPCRKDSL